MNSCFQAALFEGEMLHRSFLYKYKSKELFNYFINLDYINKLFVVCSKNLNALIKTTEGLSVVISFNNVQLFGLEFAFALVLFISFICTMAAFGFIWCTAHSYQSAQGHIPKGCAPVSGSDIRTQVNTRV